MYVYYFEKQTEIRQLSLITHYNFVLYIYMYYNSFPNFGICTVTLKRSGEATREKV